MSGDGISRDHVNTVAFQADASRLAEPFQKKFWRVHRTCLAIHVVCIFVLCLEFMFLLLQKGEFFFSWNCAWFLCVFFFTLFSYCFFAMCYHAKKPQKLREIMDGYFLSLHEILPFHRGSAAFHEGVLRSVALFCGGLRIPARKSFPIPCGETLSLLWEKFCVWTQWQDLLQIKEMMLTVAIRETICFIKKDPGNLRSHAALAEGYRELASLYQDPKKVAQNTALDWSPVAFFSQEMRSLSEKALCLALEEYKIIEEYLIDESPWIHASKAQVYHLLQDLPAEVAEYEAVLRMDPCNIEVLYRLGSLYFCLGKNAQGVKFYHRLQALDDQRAQQLINQYDEYMIAEYFPGMNPPFLESNEKTFDKVL